MVLRKVAKTIRQSAFTEVKKSIAKFQLNEFFRINKSDMVITCRNGYQIVFAGLDDVEKVKSIVPEKGVFTDAWVEEATETEKEDYDQINRRLRGGSVVPKRVTLTFNPILQSNWIFKQFFPLWDDNMTQYVGDDCMILKTTYKDNRFLTADDIAVLENETDKYFYDVYTLGNWGVLGEVIFKNWEVADLSGMRDQFINRKNGLDFGFAKDPAAGVCTHYDRERKTIYVFAELYKPGLTNDVLARELKSTLEANYDTIVCDSAEPKSIAELKQLGIRASGARKGKDSVNFGIQWLQQQKIIVDRGCQNFKNEIQAYQWKKDSSGAAIPVPVDRNNHAMDALRYAYEDEYRERPGVLTVASV